MALRFHSVGCVALLVALEGHVVRLREHGN
jgi:hypothetical protein